MVITSGTEKLGICVVVLVTMHQIDVLVMEGQKFVVQNAHFYKPLNMG
jgi:hypothetical protein